MNEKKSTFSGKLGFILTAAGSAVGLGNIWRFPYLAAQYGGGIFLLVYILLAVTFGFALMSAEIAIGRKTGLSAIGAYRAFDKRFTWVGYLGCLVPMIVLPYYSVIGGWVTKYLFAYCTGDAHAAAEETYFTDFIAGVGEPLWWFFLLVLFAALTSSISLMETVVSIFQDKFHWNRKVTSLLVFVYSLLMGIPSSLGNGIWSDVRIFGFQFLDFYDFISNSVIMPILALVTCIFVGYVIKPQTLIDEISLTGKFKAEKLFVVVIKYLAPVCIVLILVSSVLDGLGVMKI